jgi:hypothetical protein
MKKLALLLLVVFAAGTVAFAATPAMMTPAAPKAPKAKVMSMKKMGKKHMGKKMMMKKGPVVPAAPVKK